MISSACRNCCHRVADLVARQAHSARAWWALASDRQLFSSSLGSHSTSRRRSVIAWAVAFESRDRLVEDLLALVLDRGHVPQLTLEQDDQIDLGFHGISVLFVGRPRGGDGELLLLLGLTSLLFGHGVGLTEPVLLADITAAIAEPAATITSSRATAALKEATLRLRRHHRQSRSASETGRARIGLSRPEPAQVFGQGKHVGITACDVFFQALQTDRLQVARRLRLELRRGHRLLAAGPCREYRGPTFPGTAGGR